MNLNKFKELAEENLVEINKTKGMFGVVEREIVGIEELYKELIIHFVSDSFIVNGFKIEQVKNADGNYLPPSFLQWQAVDLIEENHVIMKRTKKEVIKMAQNYR